MSEYHREHQNQGGTGPLSLELRNPGHDDRWTCPGCYNDLPIRREGTYQCSKCKRQVRCTSDTQPVCVSEIVQDED